MRLTRSPVSRLRLKAKIASTREAAERLGCSRIHLANIERGAAGASIVLMGRMAGLYGVTTTAVAAAIIDAQRDLNERQKKKLKEA